MMSVSTCASPLQPVVDIARDQQFGDLMDYFWAAVGAEVRLQLAHAGLWVLPGWLLLRSTGCVVLGAEPKLLLAHTAAGWPPFLAARPPAGQIGRLPLCALCAQERSERVLALTEEIIVELNSANYTVWEWRWRCVEASGARSGGAGGRGRAGARRRVRSAGRLACRLLCTAPCCGINARQGENRVPRFARRGMRGRLCAGAGRHQSARIARGRANAAGGARQPQELPALEPPAAVRAGAGGGPCGAGEWAGV